MIRYDTIMNAQHPGDLDMQEAISGSEKARQCE